MKEIILNIIAWVICVIIGAVASRVWTFYRQRFAKEYSKFTYYRVIRLRFRDRGDAPYYVRHHHTIEGVSEPVFDETWCLNGAQCSHKEKLEPVRLTSSGLVDAIQIMPVLDRDADNHPHTRDSAKVFTFSHPNPSTQLAAVGTMINGLQTADQWWYGTTAQYDGQILLLIVDFASLPYEISPIFDVTSQLERDRVVVPKQSVEAQWFEDHVGSDIYYLKFKNAKKGDVIKFTFSVNKDLIPIVKTKGGTPRPSKA